MRSCFDCHLALDHAHLHLVLVWDYAIQAWMEHYACWACLRRRGLPMRGAA
jgi:hypothetical protein